MAQRKRRVKKASRRKGSRSLGQLPAVRDPNDLQIFGGIMMADAVPTQPRDGDCQNSFLAAYLRGRGYEAMQLETGNSVALTREGLLQSNLNHFGGDMAEKCFKMPTLRALAGLPKKPKKLGQLPADAYAYRTVNQTQADRAAGLNIPARARVSEVAVAKAEADSAQCFTAHEALAEEAFSIGASEFHLSPAEVTQARDPLTAKIQRFYVACRRAP